MRSRAFILAIDSFLVRKGMISLLNHFQEIRVIREFEAFVPLLHYAKKNGIDFLIISQELFKHAADLFLSSPELLERTLVLAQDNSETIKDEGVTILSLGADKEVMLQTIKQLIALHPRESGYENSRKLSRREETIVRLVSMGLTNKQIAENLFLSTHTVTTHRKNISSKLGIKSVSGLTVYAIVNNIITIDEVTSKHDQ